MASIDTKDVTKKPRPSGRGKSPVSSSVPVFSSASLSSWHGITDSRPRPTLASILSVVFRIAVLAAVAEALSHNTQAALRPRPHRPGKPRGTRIHLVPVDSTFKRPDRPWHYPHHRIARRRPLVQQSPSRRLPVTPKPQV